MTTSHAPPAPVAPSAPPAKKVTGEPTAATRHLCSGVYVDEWFRDLVINEVCTKPYRRVAPSYGFDIVPVMRHAWRAAALTALLRMTLLGSVVVPACAGAAPVTILLACGLALLWLLHRALMIRDADWTPKPRRTRRRRRPSTTPDPQTHFWPLTRPIDPRRQRAFRRVGVTALSLSLTGLTVALVHPDHAATALHVAAGIVLMYLGVGATRQLMLNRIRRAPTLRPTHLSGRQRAADAQQRHVCTVYRRPRHSEEEREDEDDLTMFTLFGDKSPFIGAGELVYQWNPPMNIQLLRPGDDKEPLHEREHVVPPFQAHELVDHLRDAVRLLDTDSVDVRLPTQVRDRVYVAETDVAVDPSLLPQGFDEAGLRAVINTPGTRQHHFLEVTTPVEGSEFVATVLLHVSLRGRTLIISTAACVLAHTPRSFQRTDEFGQHGAVAVVWAAFRELSALPLEIQRAWRVVRYFYAVAKAAVLPHDLTSTPIRNVLIGSRVSIREESSQAWSKVQLEKSDILGRMKTIEERLLRAAGDFLSARGVDTSAFDDRALKIINSGIFNFGDNNSFNNNAVGEAAQVGGTADQSASPNNANGGGSQ
ncbi:hypothetical protein ACQEVS_25635 [Streptomyces sp. CA-181903]|uniref:hypothetical protein n=1 Tax=Streptomyces sp. CA-181903 TaxID=3240055 RepID=UPI003D89BF61